MNNHPNLFAPLQFPCGITMKNRFLLAPMTNRQSNEDGTLTDDEFHWLTLRAKGNFGMVMTCASHVSEVGKGFPGQLGIFDDKHIPGHTRLAAKIKEYESVAIIQLHHAGMRSPKELISQAPLCPSENEEWGARAMSLQEVIQLKDDFVNAAIRAKKCGYDGVQIHGAHGYILSQFLSGEINHRTDEYGGTLIHRSRLLFEIIEETRTACGPEFLISVRLSPEKFGMDVLEVKALCERMVQEKQVDFIDISLWDVFKQPEEEKYQNKSLLKHFTDIDYQGVPLTVAGKIMTGEDVNSVMKTGVDFVSIGRAGILHHDFPNQVKANPQFASTPTPVTAEYLNKEGLSDAFVTYMRRWPNFVKQ